MTEERLRECFCPYLDGPNICGHSFIYRKVNGLQFCNIPHTDKGRFDCPIIIERGDR